MNEDSGRTILFLDFDGVLHPNEVYMRTDRSIVLMADGHNLFEHAGWLAEQLAQPAYDEVRVVLSTSWVWAMSFSEAKRRLPKLLQAKVKGATWHSSQDKYRWDKLTRFEQIHQYVLRHRLKKWVAVDDNAVGWPDEHRGNLVHTNEWRGLGDELARKVLLENLRSATK